MLSAFVNALRTPDLRRKILFTIAILAIFRLGSVIPTPNVNMVNVNACRLEATTGSNAGLYSMINLFSGGALLQLAIFALGIMPYITASIILQLLTVVIPRLETLKKEGAAGTAKITQYTRYLTLVLAVLNATAFVTLAVNGQLFQGDGGGAGEIGHVVIQENGELCRCGKRGCLETISSAQAVLRRLDQTSLEKVQSAYFNGDARTIEAVTTAAHYLGISLANLIGTLNIQKIILTGDMTRFGQPWLEAVNVSMRNAALARLSENTKLELGTLDYRACILGASAFLLLDDYSLLFQQEN